MKELLTAKEAEKIYLEQPFEVSLIDALTGRISVLCRRDCGRVMGKWQLEVDGKRDSFGQFLINSMSAGERKEYLLSVDVPDMVYGSNAVLIVRFYDEKECCLAVESFPMTPAAWLMPEMPKEQFFTGVRFDVSKGIISSGKLSAVIDADGMRELRYNGEKILSSGPRLSMWRWGMVPENLRKLKLDRIKVSADRFVSDGKSIESHALALPTAMEMDELEFTQRFTPQNDGSLRYDMEFVVPESFAGIPRLGIVMRLPDTMSLGRFLGNGPHENYPGDLGAVFSSYDFKVADMFTPHDTPRAGGCRSNVKSLELSDPDGKKHLRIVGGNSFSFFVLPYSEFALEDAAFSGTPPSAESEISLYIDCRIGENKPISSGVYRMTLFLFA